MSYEKAVSNNLRQFASAGDQFFTVDFEPSVLNLIEVYAQEAKIDSTTEDFDKDKEQLEKLIQELNFKIRIENSNGLKPKRHLRLVLKVPEAVFEEAVERLKTIGEIKEFAVTKEDKSEEVKQLIASKKSLEVFKESLEKLRSQEGKVDEFVALESKIQEVEKQIQNLGVNLGDFIQEESFSNVDFALLEKIPFNVEEDKYPLVYRVLDSLAWSVTWYSLVILLFAIGFLTMKSIRILTGGD